MSQILFFYIVCRVKAKDLASVPLNEPREHISVGIDHSPLFQLASRGDYRHGRPCVYLYGA